MTAVGIRALEANDASRLRALRLEALRWAPGSFGSSYEEEVEDHGRFEAWAAGSGRDRIFGAFAGESLVGMAGFRANAQHKTRHRGLLWGVYVTPAHRRMGLAERLVAAVVDHARAHVVTLFATVVTTNATARDLYRRLGFREIGIDPRALRVDGAYLDEALLIMELDREP
jgi:RimJ/RimL family protein N-acetyltransferase